MISDLTPQERMLLAFYIDFGNYLDVADEMGLARQTVKNLAHGIIQKLEARNITQACVRYDRACRSS